MAASSTPTAVFRTSRDQGEETMEDALHLMTQAMTALQRSWNHQTERAEQRMHEALTHQEEVAERKMQEALHQQEERAERRLQEALRLQEERAERRMQEVLRQQEPREELNLQEAVRELMERVWEAERRLQEKVDALERKVENAAGQEALEQVENQLHQLDVSLQRTLKVFFPRVEELVTKMEGQPPPDEQPSTPSNIDAACATAPLLSSPRPVPPPLPSRIKSIRGGKESQSKPQERCFTLGRELCKAAEVGSAEDVRKLLDAGAAIEAVGICNKTPLHIAADRADPTIVKLLLEYGANVNAKADDNWSPLYYTSSKDFSAQCVCLLISAGANVNEVNALGQTSLHRAAMNDNEAAVRRLLAAGANKSAANLRGETPYEYANTDSVRRLLRL